MAYHFLKLINPYCTCWIPTTMSHRIFLSIQAVMPAILAHLESIYPEEFSEANYSLSDHSKKGLVGLNLHSDKYPSTLFWIDERLTVQPAFLHKTTEAHWQLNSQLKRKISDLLKRAA